MWFWSTLERRFASLHSASSSRMAKRWRPGQSAGSSIFTNQFVTLLVIFVPYDTVCWVQILGGTCGAQVRHPGVVRGLFWDPQWRWPQCPMHWKCQWPCQKVDFELKNKQIAPSLFLPDMEMLPSGILTRCWYGKIWKRTFQRATTSKQSKRSQGQSMWER